MNAVETLTNLELLAVVTGTKRAAKQVLESTGGSIFRLLHKEGARQGATQEPLFAGEEYGVYRNEALRRISAARELVARAMLESLQTGDTLTSPAAVKTFLTCRLAGLEHEVFWVLFLDAQNRLIADEELFRGTLTQTSVYPREVVKQALYHNAAAVILAHNHPSGLPEPSRADESLTQHLKSALSMVDVRVLDHFVIGGNQTMSFAERGLL